METDNGNRADELGAAERGETFLGVNRSGMPAASPILDCGVEVKHGELMVFPLVQNESPRTLQLQHSSTDLVMAQITDDPEMQTFTVPGVGPVQTTGSRLQRIAARNANREELVWFGIDSHHYSAAMGDRIVVRRDTLESEYICQSCAGKGHTSGVCKLCDGKQRREGVNCTACAVVGYEGEKPYPSGFTKCSDCNGAGWKNGVVIPEAAQGKPVTGTIVSLGPDTKLVKLGDRVLHSKFAGHTLEMKNESYTYMRETEVISLLRER